MYSSILAALLIVGSNGLPRCDKFFTRHLIESADQGNPQPYFLGPIIANAVTRYFNNLAATGYDPYEGVGPQEINFQLQDESFQTNGVFENFRIEGISNVVINRMTTPLIPTYVDFDVVAPRVYLQAGSADALIKFASYNLQVDGSGWVVAENVRVTGRAGIRVLTPIQVTSVNAVLTVGNIQADVEGTLNGLNGSTNLNGFLNNAALTFLADNSAEGNRVVSELLKDQFNVILAS